MIIITRLFMFNLKIKAETESFATEEYGTFGWPIKYFDKAQNLNEKYNCATINLRIDDNTKPILFFENTDLLRRNNNSRFLDENTLLNGTATDWSNDIILKFPNTGTAKDNIAFYMKLQYFRQEYNSLSPNTVLKNENYFDSSFCPINVSNLADNSYIFQHVQNPNLSYIRGQLSGITNDFGYIADSGAFWDNDRILFYSQAVFQNKRTGHFYSKDKGLDNKISLDSKHFNISFLKRDVNINCKVLQEETDTNQYTPFKSIAISDYSGFIAARENLLLLGIKKDELQSLIDAADAIDQNTQLPKLSNKHHRYIFLEENLPTPKTDKDDFFYRKFKLKVQGITPSGETAIIAPNNDIFLYTRDELCFTSKYFAEYETVSTISNACKGDKGKAILEINIRLAGFGCLLPTEDFTELTEKGVKQFQRDYMDMENPTGVADIATLKKIDEFCEIYRENVDDYKCKCGTCGGFGKGQFKNQYLLGKSRIEKYHKYEYPGMHQSLLWAVSASRFYLTKKLNGEYSIRTIYSGYRCWVDNNNHGRKSTNHMGKAVDLHFNKNGILFTSDMDLLREDIYCEYIGAPKQNGNFGWLPNKFGLESSSAGASTWVHLDVREFNRVTFLKDEFFIKSNNGMNFSKKITDINN